VAYIAACYIFWVLDPYFSPLRLAGPIHTSRLDQKNTQYRKQMTACCRCAVDSSVSVFFSFYINLYSPNVGSTKQANEIQQQLTDKSK